MPTVVLAGIDSTGTPRAYLRERVTNAFPTITTDHAYIHEGIAYTLSGTQSVSAGATFTVSIQTPATGAIHFKPVGIAASGGPVTVTLVEGATVTGGSAATPRNRNRIMPSPDSSAATCKTGGTASGGTTIATLFIPTDTQGSNKLGASTAAAEEHVLDNSVTYALNVVNGAASATTIGYDIFWYEEDGA